MAHQTLWLIAITYQSGYHKPVVDLHAVFEIGNASPYSQADNDEGEWKQGPAKGDKASADFILAW